MTPADNGSPVPSDNSFVVGIARAALWEPLSRRAGLQLLWCLVALASGTLGAIVVFVPLVPGTAVSVARGAPVLAALIVTVTATGGSRRIAEWFRRGALRLLGVRVGGPPPLPPVDGRRGRLFAHLSDPASWRATIYLLLRVPFSLLHYYAVLWWVGLFNLTYPFWWGLFRNHEPGVHLRPFPAITPFGWFPVSTFPETLAVFAAGAAMVLAAPWVTRLVVAADTWLLGAMLEPGGLRTRIRQLEASRSRVVEDATTTLRRIERDLHDGTQAQLATLAMKLGQAKENLEPSSAVPYDPVAALALVNEAHGHAKDALVELRNIVRGIHPPALDVGLDTALATLVARSPVPATLAVDTQLRASTAIETITYFSVAELLANVAKHSHAGRAAVTIEGFDGRLRLAVRDDGVGGARVGAGSGLEGLADRVHAVDGHIDVSSPEGGPTVIVVDLPVVG